MPITSDSEWQLLRNKNVEDISISLGSHLNDFKKYVIANLVLVPNDF